jgi:hypothetical protein
MVKHFEKTGQKLTYEEVAGKMESELENRVLKTLQSQQGKALLSKLLGPDWEEIIGKKRKAAAQGSAPTNTLTNALNATSTVTDSVQQPQPKKSWLQEEQERSRRALEKLLGG